MTHIPLQKDTHCSCTSKILQYTCIRKTHYEKTNSPSMAWKIPFLPALPAPVCTCSNTKLMGSNSTKSGQNIMNWIHNMAKSSETFGYLSSSPLYTLHFLSPMSPSPNNTSLQCKEKFRICKEFKFWLWHCYSNTLIITYLSLYSCQPSTPDSLPSLTTISYLSVHCNVNEIYLTLCILNATLVEQI